MLSNVHKQNTAHTFALQISICKQYDHRDIIFPFFSFFLFFARCLVNILKWALIIIRKHDTTANTRTYCTDVSPPRSLVHGNVSPNIILQILLTTLHRLN